MNSDVWAGVMVALITVALVATTVALVWLVRIRRRLQSLEQDMHTMKQLTSLDDLRDLIGPLASNGEPRDAQTQELAA